ncbi:MAG: hypothetical protein AB8B69_16985 [Chitinophagales bacterium]
MTNSQNIFKQAFTLVVLFALTTLSLQNVSAHTTDTGFNYNQTDLQFAVENNDFTNTVSPFAPIASNFYSPAAMGIKIKIIIIIIIKKKKKGVVEVVGTRVAKQGMKTQLKENEILAEATRDGKDFFLMPLKGVYANSEYGFPPSFKVSKEVSAKLGIRVPFGLKASRIIMGVNKKGSFAMKDLEAEDRVK